MYFYSVSEVRGMLARSQIPVLSLLDEDKIGREDGAGTGGTLARLTVVGNLASGAVARVAVGFVLSPVTIVKARFESNHFSKEAYPSLGRALMEVYRSGGVRGLFRGFSATALRDAPYAGLYMAIYEKSKDGLSDFMGTDSRGSSMVVSASGECFVEDHPRSISKSTDTDNRLLSRSLCRYLGNHAHPSL